MPEGFSIHFEYNTPSTPQQNGRVERNLPLFEWVHAVLNSSGFHKFRYHGMLAKAANPAMLLENNLVILTQKVSSFCYFFAKRMNGIISSPFIFGKMSVVITPEKFKAKKSREAMY